MPTCAPEFKSRLDRRKRSRRHNWNHSKSTTARGYGARWVKTRKRIFERDERLCQDHKARGLLREAVEIDHVIPKADGGTDDDENLQALCYDCHKAKTDRENSNRTGHQ